MFSKERFGPGNDDLANALPLGLRSNSSPSYRLTKGDTWSDHQFTGFHQLGDHLSKFSQPVFIDLFAAQAGDRMACPFFGDHSADNGR